MRFLSPLVRPCLVALTLLLTPLAALAQPFPAPGTGAWTWQTLGEEPVNARELVFNEAGDLLAMDSDLYRYDFATGQWSLNDDIPNIVGNIRSALTLGGDTLIAARFLSRSLDGGLTWEYPCYDTDASERTCDRLSVDATSHAIHEVTSGPWAGRLLAGMVLYSDDRGASWTTGAVLANETNWGFKMHDFAPLPSGRILGAGDYGAGVSDDGGASWDATDLFAPYGFEGEAIAAWATPGSVQAHTAGGPAPACGLADATLCEGAVILTSGPDPGVAGHGEAWWTNDGGRSWTFGGDLVQIVDGPGVVKAAMLTELDRTGSSASGGGLGRGLAVLGRGFVFRTLDGGASWETIARAPTFTPQAVQIATSAEVGPDGRLYVTPKWNGTADEYVFVTEGLASDGLSYVVADEGGAPEAEALGVRVVPNPSAGSTVTVELTGEAPEVRAWVVDAVGRRVADLYVGALRGEQSVALDTSGWAAGVYTVVVESDGARHATPFTVVR